MGTFYIFCDIHKTGLAAAEFSTRLLGDHLVAVIPSEGFGVESCLRISFSTSKDNIERGIARISEFLNTF